VILENVETGAVVSTDELMSYGLLSGDGFIHGAVKHGQKEWSYYDYRTGETHSTNNIESFWKLFKYSVRPTTSISAARSCRFTSPSSATGRTIARWGT